MRQKLKNFLKTFIRIILLYSFCFSFSQQYDNVDFKQCNVNIYINPYKELVKGAVTYSFVAKKNIDSIYLDARKLQFLEVRLNGSNVKTSYDNKRLVIHKKIKRGKPYKLKIDYQSNPKKAMYFIGWKEPNERQQVWTQGQGKNNSHWLPCIEDVNEKIVYKLNLTFPESYEVIANGELDATELIQDSLKTWKFSIKKPMSSYLLAVAAGDYHKKIIYSNSKVPIVLFYYPEDSLKVEPTYRYSKRIFDFFEEKIGVPYPWKIYKQVPVKDFLYAGMENTTTTIFSDSFLVDSIGFVDKKYVNINAHELAHHWFGNLVTAKSSEHHWLQEGFATYYALLAERALFGEDYYYQKLYESAKQLISLSEKGSGESLLNPKASSLTFYEKGAWVLHMLAQKIGEENFDKTVKEYLTQYQFKSADTDAFLAIAVKNSDVDLTQFKELWITGKTIPKLNAELVGNKLIVLENEWGIDIPLRFVVNAKDTIYTKIKQSHDLTDLLVGNRSLSNEINSIHLNYAYQLLVDLQFKRSKALLEEQIFNALNSAVAMDAFSFLKDTAQKLVVSKKLLEENYPFQLKEFAVYQLAQNLNPSTIKILRSVANSKEIRLRQAVVKHLNTIPANLKESFEGLLEDKSYMTRESALFKLWVNFPEDRSRYLEITKDMIGFNNKNIRTLWLALALGTPDYNSHSTPIYYKELSKYTNQYYHFEVRQNAFTYLYQLQMISDLSLKDLIKAGTHPVWQFASFARRLTDLLLKDKDYRFRIEKITHNLSKEHTNWVLKRIE
ncbi:M1 family metallopeptidase [Ascidiimonas sp. W6]|uniref:M1 family metallopeptidase n=1 Tax=Ascidiimonas meishanensis TaxID=3128903 RepID=UPI0030EE0DA3